VITKDDTIRQLEAFQSAELNVGNSHPGDVIAKVVLAGLETRLVLRSSCFI